MPMIDNENEFLQQSLRESLKQADSIDILTGYFYFSGFNLLANELSDKKVRILVGLSVDPSVINEIGDSLESESGDDYDSYAVKGIASMSAEERKKRFEGSFIGVLDKNFDKPEIDLSIDNGIKVFSSKLEDGTLEIKMTAEGNHAKAYILTNKEKHPGVSDGVVYFGSSNFTYNGLRGQGEINEKFTDTSRYAEYKKKFDEKWESALPVCVAGDNSAIKETAKGYVRKPSLAYLIFIRILQELFSSADVDDFETPNQITKRKYSDFKYQVDAIKYGLDSLDKYDGVIIADVVGLGKSIIAASLAYNINFIKTVLIVPPNIMDMWNDYMKEFGIRNYDVRSSGKIKETYNKYATYDEPILFIIDEAHRYRNERTDNYKYLHMLTRSNADNKVILLTATPYNNRPQDLFSLVKLFQIPRRSTLNTTDNLDVTFREMISKYNFLENKWKNEGESEETRKELEELSCSIRALISPVMIRRSRIDLKRIDEYNDDLKEQGIKLPEVVGPEILDYDLGDIEGPYMRTLKALSEDFEGVRYNPVRFVTDVNGFNKKYSEKYGTVEEINQMQTNNVSNVKRLIVMRFESSKEAFKISLEKLRGVYGRIIEYWDKGLVPVQTNGNIDSPDDVDVESILDEIDSEIEENKKNTGKAKNGLLFAEKRLFSDDYIQNVKKDIDVLDNIFNEWFSSRDIADPKYSRVRRKLIELLEEDRDRKIVVFSTYADTAEALCTKLVDDGFRCLLYTGRVSTSQKADKVKRNFDASIPAKLQENDYDIIVATDALSEGFNLNRAGVVINYDIPYNPTRVVQRIGRINRINVKKFDQIYVYNFFPTYIGEELTSIKGITTLKMLLINQIVGSDTRTLTPDETLESYFKRLYSGVESDNSEMSWDVEYRNTYNSVKNNKNQMDEVAKIPEHAKIIRRGFEDDSVISYVKRGNGSLFVYFDNNGAVRTLAPEEALPYFKACFNEKVYDADGNLNEILSRIESKINEPYKIIGVDITTQKAEDVLNILKDLLYSNDEYLHDVSYIIKEYGDFSQAELKFLAEKLGILKRNNVTVNKIQKVYDEIKSEIPEHYVKQIKIKAEKIDAQHDVIMFTEGLRNE